MDEIVGESSGEIGLEHDRRDQRLQPPALRRGVHRQLPRDPGRRPQAQELRPGGRRHRDLSRRAGLGRRQGRALGDQAGAEEAGLDRTTFCPCWPRAAPPPTSRPSSSGSAGARQKEITEAKVEGKIVVTEGGLMTAYGQALQQGALGVVGIAMSRPYFDPLQMPWSGVMSRRRPAGAAPGQAGQPGPPAAGQAARAGPADGLRLPAAGPRGRHPQAPAPGQREDLGPGPGRVEDGDGRPRERHRPHPRRRPGRRRDHPVGAPLRRDAETGGQRQHLRQRLPSSRSPASSTP